MKKKIAIIVILLLLCACILSTSVAGILVFYPKYQNKKQSEIYFENIDSIDSTRILLRESNSVAANALGLSKLSATGSDEYLEQIKTFSENSLVTLDIQIETLLEELQVEEAPKPIKEDVDTTIGEMKQLSKDIDKVKGDLTYLASISTIFSDFNEEVYSISNKEFSEDLNIVITQYDSYIAEFDSVFTKYQTSLDSIEVPKSMEDFHSLVDQDINSRYKVMINFYREGRSIIVDSIGFSKNPETATTKAVAKHKERVDAFLADSKVITSKFTYKSADYDFSLIFSYNDYNEIQTRINKIEDLLYFIIEYRDSQLD